MPSAFFHLVEANNGGSNAAKGDRVVPMIMQYRSMEMGYAAIADVLNLGDVSPPPRIALCAIGVTFLLTRARTWRNVSVEQGERMTGQAQPDSGFDYNGWLKELSERGMRRSRAAAAAAVAKRIERHDAKVLPLIREYRDMGMGYAAIADVLNLGELAPPRGGFWSRMQVARICRRHGIKRRCIVD